MQTLIDQDQKVNISYIYPSNAMHVNAREAGPMRTFWTQLPPMMQKSTQRKQV